MTLYHGVVSTVLSLSESPTMSSLSYSTLLNAYRAFDSSNSALLLLSVDSDNAFWPIPPDGLLSLVGILGMLGFCPTLPIFLKLLKLSPSRMGHYGQTRTPKTGTVHRTMHSPICFRNILVESLVESVSHECPQMSSLSRGRKWDTLAAWK